MQRLISLLGLFVMMFLAWLLSVDRRRMNLRLILSGIFDEYPGLKIILGHLGEALPFWMWRMDNRLNRLSSLKKKHKRKPNLR